MKPAYDKKTLAMLALCFWTYAAGLVVTTADPDLWGYLAFGYLFWTQPGFPYTDPFSYMPTQDMWIYHEWFTGVLFFPLYAGLGEASLQVLRYAMALGAVGFSFAAARGRGASPFAAAAGVLLPAYLICPGYSPVRAQVFTYFFFALTLYVCETCRHRGRYGWLWILAPVFALWGNLHGGFAAGLGLLCLYAAGAAISRKPVRPYILAALACGCVTLVNPYGLDYWTYLIKAIAMPRPQISEWMSLWRSYRMGGQLLATPQFIGLGILALIAGFGPLRKDRTALAVLGVTACMGFLHVRHLPFFGLALAVFLASLPRYFKEILSRPGGKWRARTLVSVSALSALLPLWIIVLILHGRAVEPGAYAHPFALQALPAHKVREGQPWQPIGALAFMRAHNLSGNILTQFEWGQFVLWSLPESKVAMDGRYETVYPAEIYERYFNFLHGRPGWESYVMDFPHEIALFHANSAARVLIAKLPEWKIVYEDHVSVVFVNTSRIQWKGLGGEMRNPAAPDGLGGYPLAAVRRPRSQSTLFQGD